MLGLALHLILLPCFVHRMHATVTRLFLQGDDCLQGLFHPTILQGRDAQRVVQGRAIGWCAARGACFKDPAQAPLALPTQHALRLLVH